ncbi:MAG TPA: hypothetical protein VH092_14640 [Urbifossiella sp.]|nr:hypothetical protein [Urbifossiella sp.]
MSRQGAAAARLGIATGTLSSRLARARKILAARLRARGVVLSGAFASAATVPADLVAAAVRSGTRGPLRSVVASLADGVVAMLRLQRLKLVGVTVLCAGLVVGGFDPRLSNPATATPGPVGKSGDGLGSPDPRSGRSRHPRRS